MSYIQQYTVLDKRWHAIGEDETTYCGLVIPHGNGYAPLPGGETAHCGPGVEKPKAKKAKDVVAA